jgi:lipopolysaccharide/colanic/teichoic acid biosynthesis glycosyltransferase
MSLVGPRPERPYFAEHYHELTQRRLSVKPGITGLAQVSSRYGLTVEEKVNYDLFYIQNFSLSLDIVLLLRTFTIIVRDELSSIFSRS